MYHFIKDNSGMEIADGIMFPQQGMGNYNINLHWENNLGQLNEWLKWLE